MYRRHQPLFSRPCCDNSYDPVSTQRNRRHFTTPLGSNPSTTQEYCLARRRGTSSTCGQGHYFGRVQYQGRQQPITTHPRLRACPIDYLLTMLHQSHGPRPLSSGISDLKPSTLVRDIGMRLYSSMNPTSRSRRITDNHQCSERPGQRLLLMSVASLLPHPSGEQPSHASAVNKATLSTRYQI